MEFRGGITLATLFEICVEIETKWNLEAAGKTFGMAHALVEIETKWNLEENNVLANNFPKRLR